MATKAKPRSARRRSLFMVLMLMKKLVVKLLRPEVIWQIITLHVFYLKSIWNKCSLISINQLQIFKISHYTCQKEISSSAQTGTHQVRYFLVKISNRFIQIRTTNEHVLGVLVPYKRDRSLITWDWSQKVKCFGTGPITIIIEQLNGENHIFWILSRIQKGDIMSH